ncbi:MAG: hypothetical protein II856_04205 [Bacteroidales bacterium]|nr:hypothetical protein [Bacteroidales bacterium]
MKTLPAGLTACDENITSHTMVPTCACRPDGLQGITNINRIVHNNRAVR